MSVDEDIAIGAQFQDADGRNRHVWNVRDDRVHYFIKAEGSHWTPGHLFEAAPTSADFRSACAIRTISPVVADVPLAAPPDLNGDY